MIFFTRFSSGRAEIDKGLFISTEMSMKLASELNAGNLVLNESLIPVHMPWEGISRPDLGEHDDLSIDRDAWINAGLPPLYSGEQADGKNIVIFPMHGLGDQLYLAAAIRHFAGLHKDIRFTVVRPSIKSSDQWFSYIWFDDFVSVTGPVVSAEEMKSYDYYVNAEYFSHMKEYEGAWPSVFFLEYFFSCESVSPETLRPEISPPSQWPRIDTNVIDSEVGRLKKAGKPVVFVSSMTTGRVRDILPKAVTELLEEGRGDYSFIISAFGNAALSEAVEKSGLTNAVTTEGSVSSVDDLIYLLSEVDYIITADSGITHLAEALQKPCGSVFNVVTPDERTGYYRFSEQMTIRFEIPGVCRTPCYHHALEEEKECPGMEWKNSAENITGPRRFAPCMENFGGVHLRLLLDSLVVKFPCGQPDREESEIDRIIETNVFRKDVFDLIPEKTSRILDFGCHQGELLLRLRRDKGCTELYGIEVDESCRRPVENFLDGGWIIDMGDEDAGPGEEWFGFFNYIIMHDVVEHLYDPWFVLEKLRRYLSPEGRLIIVVPNLQFWGLLSQIINGRFPYGEGGLMNEDHIRWFTCGSIIELALTAGYGIDYFQPVFPPGTDLSGYDSGKTRTDLSFPPSEMQIEGVPSVKLEFEKDLKKDYFLFLANKLLLVCTNTDRPVSPEKLSVGGLQKRKKERNINFNFGLG